MPITISNDEPITISGISKEGTPPIFRLRSSFKNSIPRSNIDRSKRGLAISAVCKYCLHNETNLLIEILTASSKVSYHRRFVTIYLERSLISIPTSLHNRRLMTLVKNKSEYLIIRIFFLLNNIITEVYVHFTDIFRSYIPINIVNRVEEYNAYMRYSTNRAISSDL